jgi:hypothetical protein
VDIENINQVLNDHQSDTMFKLASTQESKLKKLEDMLRREQEKTINQK